MTKAEIPVLHVVGDADQVVSVTENTAIFEQHMEELHTPITVIHRSGVDHHPYSLNNPKPIVQFILKATNRAKNMCVHPVPGNEFRSAAGWTQNSDQNSITEDITATLNEEHLKLLLLGGSITQGWGGNREEVAYKPDKEAMDNAIGKDDWENAGISGDRTQNLFWRIHYDNYNSCHPENIVITIGINNLISGKDSPENTAEGIIAVANEVRKQFPESRIILLGLFPSGKEQQNKVRTQCDKIHDILQRHQFEKVEYVNSTKWFTEAGGTMKDGLYGNNYIHFTSEGYKVAVTEIAKILTRQTIIRNLIFT